MHVLVKNANVKNNYFSVIFTDNVVCSAESLKKKEQLKELEKNLRDPKQSYAFQPESEPVHSRRGTTNDEVPRTLITTDISVQHQPEDMYRTSMMTDFNKQSIIDQPERKVPQPVGQSCC